MLLKGGESRERVFDLIELTDISSESIIDGLIYHLVRGLSVTNAAELAQVPRPNLRRALVALNKKNVIVERIKERDWERFKNGRYFC